ncbi:MAG: aconitate hydratase, partial [Rhodoferax sp.]
MPQAFRSTLKTFHCASGKAGRFYSLPALARKFPNINRLPVSLRIVLESVLRNCDGKKVTAEHVAQVAGWQAQAQRTAEIPFVVSRVVLQDFTGVPLLADLAAMRSTAQRLGLDPRRIEPLVPVDLVVDHSIMVDHYGKKNSLDLNMKLEFQRNRERYEFMKWGMQAFDTFGVVPPGFGIVHQVNLEYLARGVHKTKDGIYYPDTLVGTDSHTTMINGIGVVGWGVGGIEAEAAMLGQPVYFLTPDVVGFELSGRLREGVTATDLVLTVTETLRRHKVVGKFVEFFGEGTRTLALPDRATIANMAPEYGATMGFFPVDEKTIDYFKGTGRTRGEIEAFEAYFKAQGLFGVPLAGEIDYSQVVKLDLGSVTPSLAGPKRPQDRIELGRVAAQFADLFSQPSASNGFNQPAEKLLTRYPLGAAVSVSEAPAAPPLQPGAARDVAEMVLNRPTLEASKAAADAPAHTSRGITVGNGDVLIAAITSCTNTSNPGVLIAAGLLARNALERGLSVKPWVKTSLAPGSQVVTDYLNKAGLSKYLDKLGFNLVGYGCTTCIGNSGPLSDAISAAVKAGDLIAGSVSSGNRNFEGRINPDTQANYLASPPLVVAYAIAGNLGINLTKDPIGKDKKGKPVYLKDVWPSNKEIAAVMKKCISAKLFRDRYSDVFKGDTNWRKIKPAAGQTYKWNASSTYVQNPPYFTNMKKTPGGFSDVKGARVLGIFGDSITTDHISPAGSIKLNGPAGKYLSDHKVTALDFNSYGARRGNHEVMMRGTFA